VVTGVNFLDLNVTEPPRRRILCIKSQNIETRTEAVTSVGGVKSTELSLYDGNDKPVWHQEPNERYHPDLNSIGVRVPKWFDVVRIKLDIEPKIREMVEFNNEDINTSLWGAGNDVLILGYPHGYSAMEFDAPEPIFLKRTVASNRNKATGFILLDGGASPGMSGSPIIIRREERWWLAGMYTGILFPDYQHRVQSGSNDRFAALGMMAPIMVVRAFMRVPGMYD